MTIFLLFVFSSFEEKEEAEAEGAASGSADGGRHQADQAYARLPRAHQAQGHQGHHPGAHLSGHQRRRLRGKSHPAQTRPLPDFAHETRQNR